MDSRTTLSNQLFVIFIFQEVTSFCPANNQPIAKVTQVRNNLWELGPTDRKSDKTAGSDDSASIVSNNFPYKLIILIESCILSPIYTSRIRLLSNLEIFKLNKNIIISLWEHTKKIHMHHGHVKKREPFGFVPLND